MPKMTAPTLEPRPAGTLPFDESVTRTEPERIPERARELYRVMFDRVLASQAADDVVICLEVEERITRASAESYWTSLDDAIRESGLDPADFGL